jgi:glycosyltransferase involved in cell wall biosynthesis
MVGGTRSYEMARRLVAAGHEVQMVTADCEPSGRGKAWYETEEAGAHVHWFPIPYSNAMSYRDRMRAFSSFAYAATRKAASLAGDVVFATSTPLTVAIPAVYASRRHRVPMVFEVRDLWPEVPIAIGALRSRGAIAAARGLERFAYRNASHIVALSPGMRDGVARTGFPPARIEVIPNSADLELFSVPEEAGQAFRKRHAWLQDRPLVLYAGTLGRANGCDYLVRLAHAVRDDAPEVRFLIVGEGGQEARVRELAAGLGVLDKTLYMMPPVSKLEMPAILSAATIATSLFIDLKALWANSANKFFDALAAGKPIAINYGGWQAQMLLEEEAGIVLDPHDLGKAKAILLRALGDAAWLERAGRNSRGLATHRFSRDQLARQLEDVLLRATGASGPTQHADDAWARRAPRANASSASVSRASS